MIRLPWFRKVTRNAAATRDEPLPRYTLLFDVDLTEEEPGAWSATVPSLPGCAVDAESPQQALQAIQEMAEAYVTSVKDDIRRLSLADRWSSGYVVAVPVVAAAIGGR